MRNKIHLWRRVDGGITMIVPAWDDLKNGYNPENETEEEFYNRAMALTLEKAPEKPAEVLGNVDMVDLPYWGAQPNRTFRNALDWDGTKPVVNMDKARGIKMGYIRKARDARLAATDLDVLKLDGAAVPAPLKAKRQVLRDMPAIVQPDLDAATTVEGLEAFEPTWP